MPAMVDPGKISDLIIACAEEYILPRYQSLLKHEIDTKSGPNDLVTQADRDVEAHLERVLLDLLPGSTVVGEEGVSNGAVSLKALSDPSAIVWVVDPVDGTYNFVHGQGGFGVILALIRNGRTVAGWIYNIPDRQMAVVEQGSGAYIGTKKLRVSQGKQAANLSGFLNSGFFPKKHKARLQEAEKSFKSCRSLRCAAYEYMHIAKGEAEFSLYSRLKPWDHLAGVLMVQEAGGYAAKWDRQSYTPADVHQGLIVAAGEHVWETVFEKFIDGML